MCEDFGHDLVTGAPYTEADYRYMDPDGRALLRAADFLRPEEEPDDDYPLLLTTGRVVHHFHTRTKTGRAPELNAAAPDVFVELSRTDADALGVADGDTVRVESRRGAIEGRARVGHERDGVVFVPFHYGWWDAKRRGRRSRPRSAANFLTPTEWDPVSKQPLFKVAAVRVGRVP